ncbi:hypothetical protein LCGC14_1208320 [marine sediment metagenome]|uniref:Uncharacterized protein n=1 Tax=marine sediment metagenome TaxID=412755 RepID=A0A0F9NX53_9ZZZZ
MMVGTDTVCPQCDRRANQWIDSDHARSPFAWRIRSALAVFCDRCRPMLRRRRR